MAYTADYVFEKVMHMHDDGDETTGQYDTTDNLEYKHRMLPLINLRLSELRLYTSPTPSSDGNVRPPVTRVDDWSDEINLDDLCMDALCFGVASLLYAIEDTASANLYQQEYERLLQDLKTGRGMGAVPEAVTDVYSGSYIGDDGKVHYNTGYYPHNHFGKWA